MPQSATGAPELGRTRTTLAIIALGMGGFGIGVTEFAIMGLLQEATADLDITIPQGGHLITAYALGVVVGAPIITILCARMRRKNLVVVLAGVIALGSVASFFAPGYYSMGFTRFLTGLPHGAYFGVAALLATSLVSPARRSQALAWVMLGLSVANVIGVPAVTWLGQAVGWRSMFLVVAGVAALTVLLVVLLVPGVPAPVDASKRRELAGFKSLGLWLAMLTGIVGFGGFFAVYSYISPILTDVSHLPIGVVPLALALYGVGMVCGGLLGGRLADWSLAGSIYLALAVIVIMQVLFYFLSPFIVPAMILIFALGVAGSMLVPSLQTLMIDSSPRAPSLASSLTHSAFNVANALGAFLGGVVIAQGMGLRAPALVGAGLAAAGLVVAVFAVIAVNNPGRLRRRPARADA